MAQLAHHVPLDVIREIVSYVDDIDVRRAFGVYHRITSYVDTKYDNISRVLRCKPPVDHAVYTRYYLRNLHDEVGMHRLRKEQRVDDDMLDISVHVSDNSVKYRFYLFRLKPKTGSKQKEEHNLFHKGNLDNWYWDYVYYTHCNGPYELRLFDN